jgi:hypothetical protein
MEGDQMRLKEAGRKEEDRKSEGIEDDQRR